MRNAGFILAVAAALGAGTLIGWYAIPALSPMVLSSSGGGLSAIRDLGPKATAPATDSGLPEGLRFTIDTTRPVAGSGGSPYRPSPPSDPTPCSMPSAGEAMVVVFGVYEGQALSTVALGSRDEVTGVLDVVIERGDQPLYVVLSAYGGLIWRFSGDLDRVQRVVLVAGRADDQDRHGPLAGVVGLPPERVTTTDHRRCFSYAYQPGSMKAAVVAATVRRAAGKAPDVLAGHYGLAAVRLPSAMGAEASRDDRPPAPASFDRGQWNTMLQFNPAGLIAIDPETVVSAAPVLAYDVLPQQAGLAQLVGSGDLERIADGLKVVRPIPRFPAGLNGAHSTAFLIGRGVPVPGGDAGHSCVLMESTGEPPADARRSSICGLRGRAGARRAAVPRDPAFEAAERAADAAERAAAAADVAIADRRR